jgi:hypothetical protein
VTIDNGPADPTTGTSATFAFHADETATFQCKLDGGTYTACTSPAAYTSLADGTHTFSVTATDTAGNTSAAVDAAWTRWCADFCVSDWSVRPGREGRGVAAS